MTSAMRFASTGIIQPDSTIANRAGAARLECRLSANLRRGCDPFQRYSLRVASPTGLIVMAAGLCRSSQVPAPPLCTRTAGGVGVRPGGGEKGATIGRPGPAGLAIDSGHVPPAPLSPGAEGVFQAYTIHVVAVR